MDLRDIMQEAEEIALAHGWRTDDRTVGDLIALMHSELSEALEEYRNGHEVTEIYYDGEKPEGVPIELADVIIRIANFAESLGVDIERAIRLKLDYNRTRPFKHGGKRL